MIIEYRPKSEEPRAPLPANFSISQAQLPAAYEHAKTALAECASIDECQDWADKAAALASYAKMAEDDTLERHATRIRARAIRRAGELLKQIEPATGAHLKTDGADTLSRKEAAKQAGMSERQQVTAIRVASVPAADFERQVESSNPATVTKLAEQGKKIRNPGLIPEVRDLIAGTSLNPDDYARLPPNDQIKAAKRDLALSRTKVVKVHAVYEEPEPIVVKIVRPAGFAEATEMLGTIEMFAEFCRTNSPETIAAAVMSHEIGEAREHVATIDGWLDRFVVNLKG